MKDTASHYAILPRSFYLQDTFVCLRECLGKLLVRTDGDGITAGRIVEVEAYIGGADKGSHSYKGRRTARTEVQFGIGGHAYIFTVHTHHLFCFVTRREGISDVVLIRAIEPVYGIGIMKKRRGNPQDSRLLGNGPGKLCASLNISKTLYGIDLTEERSGLVIGDDGYRVDSDSIIKTERIGIDYAEEYKDMPWRYYLKGNRYVSRV